MEEQLVPLITHDKKEKEESKKKKKYLALQLLMNCDDNSGDYGDMNLIVRKFKNMIRKMKWKR